MIGGEEIQYAEGIVQGSPTAMAMYAITVIPLILMIVDITRQDNSFTKTVAYADDFTAARKITQPKMSTWFQIWLLSQSRKIPAHSKKKSVLCGRYFF